MASQADREQVLGELKAAFVQGRLTKDEFDERVGQALAAYAELDALTADIPAGPTATQLRELERESHNRAGIT
jgi:acyl carrier protein phosphodiesterase